MRMSLLFFAVALLQVSVARAELECTFTSPDKAERGLRTTKQLKYADALEKIKGKYQQTMSLDRIVVTSAEDLIGYGTESLKEAEALTFKYGADNLFVYHNSEDFMTMILRPSLKSSLVISNFTEGSEKFEVEANCKYTP